MRYLCAVSSGATCSAGTGYAPAPDRVSGDYGPGPGQVQSGARQEFSGKLSGFVRNVVLEGQMGNAASRMDAAPHLNGGTGQRGSQCGPHWLSGVTYAVV